MGTVIWVLILALIIGVSVAIVVAMPSLRLAARARRDYRAARGTVHKREIEQALGKLPNLIATEEAARREVDAQRIGADRQEAFALDRALADHLVNTLLDDVAGIGRARVEAIKAQVYNGDLQSLRQAESLPGIGPQTQLAISFWVEQVQRNWQEHLRSEFDGKVATSERFDQLRADLTRRHSSIQATIDELRALEQRAQAELARLRAVTPADFRAGLGRKHDPEQSSAIESYLLGVYPPWQPTPDWYRRLLDLSGKDL